MSDALLIPMAVATGVVVNVVAIAVLLVVLFVTMSMRGRQRRGATRRGENRQELAEAHERAARADRERDIAEEQAQQRNDRDRQPSRSAVCQGGFRRHRRTQCRPDRVPPSGVRSTAPAP